MPRKTSDRLRLLPVAKVHEVNTNAKQPMQERSDVCITSLSLQIFHTITSLTAANGKHRTLFCCPM